MFDLATHHIVNPSVLYIHITVYDMDLDDPFPNMQVHEIRIQFMKTPFFCHVRCIHKQTSKP
jgi:hypothetical protein